MFNILKIKNNCIDLFINKSSTIHAPFWPLETSVRLPNPYNFIGPDEQILIWFHIGTAIIGHNSEIIPPIIFSVKAMNFYLFLISPNLLTHPFVSFLRISHSVEWTVCNTCGFCYYIGDDWLVLLNFQVGELGGHLD